MRVHKGQSVQSNKKSDWLDNIHLLQLCKISGTDLVMMQREHHLLCILLIVSTVQCLLCSKPYILHMEINFTICVYIHCNMILSMYGRYLPATEYSCPKLSDILGHPEFISILKIFLPKNFIKITVCLPQVLQYLIVLTLVSWIFSQCIVSCYSWDRYMKYFLYS